MAKSITDLPNLVKRFSEKTQGNFNDDMRAVGFKLFSGVIKASPVDTGRFKGNWFPTYIKPSVRVNETKDKTAKGSISSTKLSSVEDKTSKWRVGETKLYLTNNLPYATVIEYGGYSAGSSSKSGTKVTQSGYSKQAPSGVVRATVRRISYSLLKELKN